MSPLLVTSNYNNFWTLIMACKSDRHHRRQTRQSATGRGTPSAPFLIKNIYIKKKVAISGIFTVKKKIT